MNSLNSLFFLIGTCFLVKMSNAAFDPVPAAEPNDGVFGIVLRTGVPACVYGINDPIYKIIYPQIDYLSSDVCKLESTAWRYDVLNRISMRVSIEKNKQIDLCITEQTVLRNGKWMFPDSRSWDYLILKPCVLDDPRQQWRYEFVGTGEKDHLVNVGSGYKMGENEWTLATSVNLDRYLYKFRINRDNPWLHIKAEPRGYQYTLNLKWLYNGRFYRDFGNSKGTLRYDPSNNQISRTDKSSLYCLTSNHIGAPESVHKAWVTWEKCADQYVLPATKILKQQWIVGSNNNSTNFANTGIQDSFPTVIIDAAQNVLRIKQAGQNWGKPYTYKLQHIKEDLPTPDNPVTSIFYENGIHSDWRAIIAGDNIQSLKTCPADGISTSTPPISATTLLLANFILTNKWIDRLYRITTSPSYSSMLVGACGACSMQSMEAIMNFDKYQNNAPPASASGLLFKDYNKSPMEAFKEAYKQLSKNMDIITNVIYQLADTQNGLVISKNYNPEANKFFAPMMMQATFQVLLKGARLDPKLTEAIRAPQTRPVTLGYLVPGISKADAIKSYRRIVEQPVGTVWIFVSQYGFKDKASTTSTLNGHAIFLVKYTNGVGFFPTTLTKEVTSKEAFTKKINQRAGTSGQLWRLISDEWRSLYPFGYQFYAQDFYQIRRISTPMNYIDSVLSRENCLNEKKTGAMGFGTGQYSLWPKHMNLCGNEVRCVEEWYNPSCKKSQSSF